jgi:hypothetical protein
LKSDEKRVQDAGFWILDARYKMQVIGDQSSVIGKADTG